MIEEENVNEEVPYSGSSKTSSFYWKRFYVLCSVKETIHRLTQVLDTNVSRDTREKLNPNASTTASIIRDFTSVKTRTFFGFKVEDEPQGFIDEMFKVLDAMLLYS